MKVNEEEGSAWVRVFLPMNEEGLVQAIEDVDDDVVVSDRVDFRSRKLPIYQYTLEVFFNLLINNFK